ncbi:MAG TPA: hypothetical protein VG916_08430 [Gemmatimonadaceae bacterium]|nr:hypothetical protein [Gemmatimonadaceae bacterium]
MQSRWLRRTWVLGAVAAIGCPDLSSITDTSTSGFQAVMITATWSGGATGAPIDVKSVTPTSYDGALCPASSLKMANHSHDYDGIFGTGSSDLVLTNNCTTGYFAAICVASGSGGGGTDLPTCATDPRKSSPDQLYFTRLSPGSPNPVGTTGVNLTVVIQYCSTTTSIKAFVSNAASTDCVAQ